MENFYETEIIKSKEITDEKTLKKIKFLLKNELISDDIKRNELEDFINILQNKSI